MKQTDLLGVSKDIRKTNLTYVRNRQAYIIGKKGGNIQNETDT